MDNKLEQARKIINEVDRQMADLFIKRMKATQMVHEYKQSMGLPILDAVREKAVIDTNSALVEDEVLKGYYIDYLNNLMSISRAYQSRMQSGLRIAYSGIKGAFAHIAASRIFPNGQAISYPDFQAAYDAVIEGEVDVVVLPIENSFAGEVGQTIDLIFEGSLYMNGIYELDIEQNLLGVKGACPNEIQKVISHPQALSQCHEYIHHAGYQTEEATNTAVAARKVAQLQDKSIGAIAGQETAAIYGLEVLEKKINERGDNRTRFAVLSKVAATGFKSTVLMFRVKHEAGCLAKAISIIGDYGYNMTSLRSRPMKKQPWQYYFYVEIDGCLRTQQGQVMMGKLSEVCDLLKIAGTFTPHTEI